MPHTAMPPMESCASAARIRSCSSLSPALRCIARSQCLSSSSPPVPLLARTRAQIFDDRTHTHTKIFYSWRRTPCCGYGTSSAVGRMGPVRSRPTMARSSCFVSLSMYVCLCFTRMHDSAYSLETWSIMQRGLSLAWRTCYNTPRVQANSTIALYCSKHRSKHHVPKRVVKKPQ